MKLKAAYNTTPEMHQIKIQEKFRLLSEDWALNRAKILKSFSSSHPAITRDETPVSRGETNSATSYSPPANQVVEASQCPILPGMKKRIFICVEEFEKLLSAEELRVIEFLVSAGLSTV